MEGTLLINLINLRLLGKINKKIILCNFASDGKLLWTRMAARIHFLVGSPSSKHDSNAALYKEFARADLSINEV